MIPRSVKAPTIPIAFNRLLKIVAIAESAHPHIGELIGHLKGFGFEVEVTNGFDRASYKQRVTHFTEELPFLSEADKDWVMGKAILTRLNWT